MAEKDLTRKYVSEALSYCPDLGILVWKTRPLHHFPSVQETNRWNTRFAGKAAGYTNKDGYLRVKVANTDHQAHRIIWLLETGSLPEFEIDHEDGDPSNNRWENLREATHTINMQNRKLPSHNKSGRIGVHRDGRERRWRVQIGGRTIGYHDTIYEALLARWGAEKELNYHKNHGRR